MVYYLDYQGKKLPVLIDYSVLKKFQQRSKGTLTELQDRMELYEPLVYLALQRGAKIEDEEFTLKLNQMEELLNECYWQFLELFPKFFEEQMEKQTEAGGKKTTKKK